MGEETDWHILAQETQVKFFQTLGLRPFDEIEKTNLFLLKKKVGFATCGRPSELPCCANYNTGYSNDQLAHIKPVCSKIIEKSDYDPIRFACVILIPYNKKIQHSIPVFRITTSTGNIFIDTNARVYKNWNHFIVKNQLPDCEYCFPLNGEYDGSKDYLVGFAFSPASGVVRKTAGYLDVAGSVVSVAAASVCAAGLFISVAPAVATVAATTAACTGVYGVTRSVGSLYDRNRHEQSIGLSDRESRSAWLSIGSSALGATTVAAIGKAQQIVESGKSLGRAGALGLHALTASSVAFTGYGFVDALFICADKYKHGKLTKKDVFDLSCEILFLFNAIASAKATAKLVNRMSMVINDPSTGQIKLTKTQKRNLRRRAAKKRAKGLPPTSTEEVSRAPNTATGMSPDLQQFIYKAVINFSPVMEEIAFVCQSVGHDIMCWKNKEYSDVQLMMKLFRTMEQLYNNHMDEIAEATMKVANYFSSSALDKVKEDIQQIFKTSFVELHSMFYTKVNNMEKRVDGLINNAEREVIDLQEQLGIELYESDTEYDDNFDEKELNSEAKNLLSVCINLASSPSCSCKDLQDFSDILDIITHEVAKDFEMKMSKYKASLKKAKTNSGKPFDLELFHLMWGIEGDVVQHMFKESLQSVLFESRIVEHLKTIALNKEVSSVKTTPMWEGLIDEVFCYFGVQGSGALKTTELLSVISRTVNIPLSESNCQMLKSNGVVVLQLKDNSKMNIVVYDNVMEDNTASGVVVIVK